MRFTHWLLLIVVGLGLVAGCQPATEEASEPEAPAAEPAMSDDDMLAAQADAFAAAWDEGDAAGIAALFIEDGDIVTPDGMRFHGRQAIQARYEELLGGMYQGTTLSVVNSSTTFPSPDTAILHGNYEIHGMKNADGEDVDVKGVFMNVAVKQNGEWKIHSSRPMVPLPAPSAGT